MFYICNNCNRVHDARNLKTENNGSYCCTTPGCRNELFEIDELMVPVIIALWEKGYETKACCSGHYNGNAVNVPYIIFDDSSEKGLVKAPEEFTFRRTEGGIVLEPLERVVPNMVTILRRNKTLLEWLSGLDDIES